MEEVWKDIPEYKGLYQVSNLGRVKSLKYSNSKNERELKLSFDNCGYKQIGLYKNQKQTTHIVHRLLMLAFRPEDYFQGAVVNHKNGIKDDNRLDNLEWTTQSKNIQHAFRTGLKVNKSGEKHYRSKVNNKIVSIIRQSLKNKYFTQYELSHIFNISQSAINSIHKNKTWKTIQRFD